MKNESMKKWLLVILVLHITIIVFQIIPYGVAYKTMIMADGKLQNVITEYSYFSSYLFMGVNAAPLFSAITSTIAAVFCLINVLNRQRRIRYLGLTLICLFISVVGSVITLIFNTTIVAGVVTGLLIIVFLLYVLLIRGVKIQSKS